MVAHNGTFVLCVAWQRVEVSTSGLPVVAEELTTTLQYYTAILEQVCIYIWAGFGYAKTKTTY
jgi:hypothetical protein